MAPSSSTTRAGSVRDRPAPLASLIPPVKPYTVHHIPANWIETQSSILSNKLVLSFESELNFLEARAWIKDYNQKSKIRLTLHDELPNTLFVVHFDVVDIIATKNHLIAASPLEAAECFASVNEFSLGLDACNIPEFKHLVTINIRNGNSEIFSYIEYIAATLGTVVKAHLSDHQLISIVIETTRKIFLSQGHFRLPKSKGLIIINFEFSGHNQRCCFCFSYRHRLASFHRPRPAFFNTLDPGEVNDFAGGHLTSTPTVTQRTAQPLQLAPAQSRGSGGFRPTHGHHAPGDSLGGHAGVETIGESSAQGRSRNRPCHLSSHYRHRVLTSSNPGDSYAGLSEEVAPASSRAAGAPLDPSAETMSAAPFQIPPQQALTVNLSKTLSAPGTSGAGARRQIWRAKTPLPLVDPPRANPLTPPNTIAIGNTSHGTTLVNYASTHPASPASPIALNFSQVTTRKRHRPHYGVLSITVF